MIEWDILIRRFVIAIVFIVGGVGLGKIQDVNKETLRPWVKYVRQRPVLRLVVLGVLAAVSATLFDWWLFDFVVAQYETNRLLGHVTVFFGLLALGAGFPLGEWVAHTDYKPIEGWRE
jgi:hypothetical protein